MEKENIIANIVLIFISLCYIYLSIVILSYLRKKKNIEDKLEIYNDRLEDTRKSINFSFKLCKKINSIGIICLISLVFSIVYLNINESYIANFVITAVIYYSPLSISINLLLFILINISIILYFRCDKSYFKDYIKMIIKLIIVDFMLIVLLVILLSSVSYID